MGSRVIGSRMWLKSSLGSRVDFDSRVSSKSKNWNSHYFPINGMWLFKISGSISKSIGTGINVGSKNGSKLGKDTRGNIDSKIRVESQSWGSGLHSHLSSISLNEKVANLSRFGMAKFKKLWWNWNLVKVFKTPWFFILINMVRQLVLTKYW